MTGGTSGHRALNEASVHGTALNHRWEFLRHDQSSHGYQSTAAWQRSRRCVASASWLPQLDSGTASNPPILIKNGAVAPSPRLADGHLGLPSHRGQPQLPMLMLRSGRKMESLANNFSFRHQLSDSGHRFQHRGKISFFGAKIGKPSRK